MRAVRVLLAASLIFSLGAATGSTETSSESEQPEALFERAFAADTGPLQRVRLLESLAKEHPLCAWSDDALWVLGEAARQQGNLPLMARYWQYLMTCQPDVDLEERTTELTVYRTSAVPQVRRLLVVEGKAYVRHQPRVTDGGNWHVVENARRLNVVPMIVWGDLAAFYEQAGRPKLALKAYRRAMQCAPADCMWLQAYRGRIRQIEQEMASGLWGPEEPSESAAREEPPEPEPEAQETEPAEVPEQGSDEQASGSDAT
ncbi:MAG: hypothetical protein R6V05_05755 [Candidatus Brocadiia bacterium]